MKFIAHRGFSHAFPENTLPAFKAVIDHPCNGNSLIGIELDIHLTGDDIIPVMHETTVTNLQGIPVPVADCSFSELQTLTKQHTTIDTPDIPTMQQVLDLVNHRTLLCFEIKIGSYDISRFTRLVSEVLTDYKPANDVVISSFSFEILEYVQSRLNHLDIKYGFIFKAREALERVPKTLRCTFNLLNPWHRLILDTPDYFSPEGPPLWCWTVNDRATIDQLIALSSELPIEAIMTDNIDLAKQFTD